MKDSIISLMISLMPMMKPLMWIGIAALIIGTLAATTRITAERRQEIHRWALRALSTVAVFFLLAQLMGSLLNMPPTINFGDASKFQFILVSFWVVGTALLIGALALRWLGNRYLSQTS